MNRTRPGRRRSRGTIDKLPSGGLRVRVYAGKDDEHAVDDEPVLTDDVDAGYQPAAARD